MLRSRWWLLLGILEVPGPWLRGEEVEDVPGGVFLRWLEGVGDLQLGLASGFHPPVTISLT